MQSRAVFTKSFLRRYLLIAAVFLGWGAYCAWDGFVAYPREFPVAEEFAKLEGMESGPKQERWEQLAREKGWKLNKPHTAEEIQSRIFQQDVMLGICLLVGLPALLKYFSSRNSWVEGTTTGWTTSWGESVEFKSVKQLNKKKWKNKGIARATYESNGQEKTFVFDDFKFDREPTGKILRNLEATLSDEQIVEGPREEDTREEETVADAE